MRICSIAPHRPVGLFHSYWKNPDSTAKCFRGKWYLTGDCAYTDEDGYFWYQARTDDMIISAGYNIAGPEVESALLLMVQTFLRISLYDTKG